MCVCVYSFCNDTDDDGNIQTNKPIRRLNLHTYTYMYMNLNRKRTVLSHRNSDFISYLSI